MSPGNSFVSMRNELLVALATDAYQRGARVELSYGSSSNEYIDCRLALSKSQALCMCGELLSRMLCREIVAVGGLTMGADPIAMSMCHCSEHSFQSLRWFSVRKSAKEHGAKRLIEGSVHHGEQVCVVDDVATSGASVIQAINSCREFGLVVVQVIVLVDRQAGGLDRIREAASSARVSAVFTMDEVREAASIR